MGGRRGGEERRTTTTTTTTTTTITITTITTITTTTTTTKTHGAEWRVNDAQFVRGLMADRGCSVFASFAVVCVNRWTGAAATVYMSTSAR